MRGWIVSAAVMTAAMLGACASSESAAPEPSRAPPPPVASAAPAPTAPAGPSIAAPGVTVAPVLQPRVREGDVTVPGQREIPAPSPTNDTRTNEQRMRDIRAWDQCVMRAQGMAESDSNRPQLTSPEEICSRSLGMGSRTSVPDSRRN